MEVTAQLNLLWKDLCPQPDFHKLNPAYQIVIAFRDRTSVGELYLCGRCASACGCYVTTNHLVGRVIEV
jgi:hypothetical protein